MPTTTTSPDQAGSTVYVGRDGRTMPRRCSLHTAAIDLRPTVRALPDAVMGETVIVEFGVGNALVLDVETANELAEALTRAVYELDDAADAARRGTGTTASAEPVSI